LPPTGTTAERAAVLRAENPQIDAQGAAMRAQAAAAQPSAAAPIATPAVAGPAVATPQTPTLSPAAIAGSINRIVQAKGLKLSPAQVQSAYQAIKNEGLAPLEAVQREVLKQFAATVPGTMTEAEAAAERAARINNRSPVRP
jgi:hypothetical protein